MNDTTLTRYLATEQEIVTRAARAGFRLHAAVYAVVMPILALVNILAVPQFYWFEFPMLGWGLGLAMHYALGYRRAAEQTTRHQSQVTLAALHP